MSYVVSQAEIIKYKDDEKAVFPAGSVITPSAREWASEHHIQISLGEPDLDERTLLLKNIVSAISNELAQKDKKTDVKTMIELVLCCLEKIGCKVN